MAEIDELRKRANELEAIFRAFPDLLFRLDVDGTILDYKAGDESDLYVPPKIFLGKKVYDVLPPNVAQQCEMAVRQAKQTNQMVTIDYSLPMKEGEQFYEARILPMEDNQVITIIRNITQRKRMENQLRQNEEWFRQLLEISPDMVFLLDREERFVYLNLPAAALLGGAPKDFIGKKQSEVLPQGEAEANSKMVQTVFNTGYPYVSERPRQFKEKQIWTESRLLPIRGANNEISLVLSFTRDISDHKEIEDKLQKKLDDLQYVNEMARQVESKLKEREQEINGLLKELGRSPKY